MKKAVKQKVETLATLKVDKETQKRVKEFCVANNLWMCRFVEEVMNDYLNRNEK